MAPENWEGGKDAAGHDPATWHTLLNDKVELITLGAGCYWGTEKYFARDFATQFPGGIIGTCVGFMNPDPATQWKDPSYDDVCMGHTGHVEVCHVLFDKTVVSLDKVLKFFYSFHDPTELDKQGNDRGS